MATLRKKIILTVNHDAGGAEIISSYVRHNLARAQFFCLAQGPAEKIFKRKKLDDLLVSKARFEAMSRGGQVDLVLTGTSSPPSTLECDARAMAKKIAIKTAVFLDHWVNYRERFGYPGRNWENYLPDEIWAGDRHAYELAKRFFRKKGVKLVPNNYLKDMVDEYRQIRRKAGKNARSTILFISEPVNRSPYKSVLTEKDVFKKILAVAGKSKKYKKIIIRLHPAERKDKYDHLLSDRKGKLRIIKSKKKLVDDLAMSSLVVGIESMALAVAHLCGKKVISILPKRKTQFFLPFNIIKIDNLNKIDKYFK